MLCLPSSAAFARDATTCLLCFATTDFLYDNVEGRLNLASTHGGHGQCQR